jgi:hypothetical protein
MKIRHMTALLIKSNFRCLYGSLKSNRAEYINIKPKIVKLNSYNNNDRHHLS